MKKTTIISIYIILAVLLISGCQKNSNVCAPAGAYAINPDTIPMIPADGRTLVPIKLTLPPATYYVLDSQSVLLTISDGALIFNSSAPTNRLVLSYAQIANPYVLYIRPGTNPDANVILTMQNTCGTVAQQHLTYVTPAQLFTQARWHMVTDSSRAATNPYVTMYITTDSTLAPGPITIISSSVRATANPLTVNINPSGRSANFTVSFTGSSPDTSLNIMASLGGYQIDTLLGFYNIYSLLNNTSPAIDTASTSINGNPAFIVIFKSNIPQLAGYPVTFASSQGTFYFANRPDTMSITLPLSSIGSDTVYFAPPPGSTSNSLINITYYGNYYDHIILP